MRIQQLSNDDVSTVYVDGTLVAGESVEVEIKRKQSKANGIVMGALMDGATWAADKVTFKITIDNTDFFEFKDEIGDLLRPAWLPRNLHGEESVVLHIKNTDLTAAHSVAAMVGA